MNITFDTLKFSERLRKAGATEEYAKAEAEALRDALSEATDSALATKQDIYRLEAKLDKQTWLLGIVLAFLMTILVKLFF